MTRNGVRHFTIDGLFLRCINALPLHVQQLNIEVRRREPTSLYNNIFFYGIRVYCNSWFQFFFCSCNSILNIQVINGPAPARSKLVAVKFETQYYLIGSIKRIIEVYTPGTEECWIAGSGWIVSRERTIVAVEPLYTIARIVTISQWNPCFAKIGWALYYHIIKKISITENGTVCTGFY